MFRSGFESEVRGLLDRGWSRESNAFKAIGYGEVAAILAGEMDHDAAVSAIQQQTRNYAKRQMTWFRHQLTPWRRVEAQYSESLRTQIFSFILPFVLTGTG